MQFVEPPPPVRAGKATSSTANQMLKDDLYRKLTFPCGCSSSRQQTCLPSICSRRIENIRVVGGCGRSEIGVVENVENLSPELHVEVFRNSLNAVVFEHREVQGCYAGTDLDIATGIAEEAEASAIYWRKSAYCI